jgi:hypothetical protein
MAWKRKSKQDKQRPWRPDFRVVDTLPDTKVIRTNFLLNTIAVTVTLALLVYVSLQEYNLHSLRNDLQLMTAQVEGGNAANRQLLNLNRDWLKASGPVKEAVRFHDPAIDHHDFLVQMADARPDGIIYSSINIVYSDAKPGKDGKVPLRIDLAGRIVGDEDSSPALVLEELQQQLRTLPVLLNRVDSITVAQFNRDSALGVFTFVLNVRLLTQPVSPS